MTLMIKAKQWDEPLSPHFSLKEFRCRCDNAECLVTKVDMALVDLLEEIRADLDMPLKVTSGYRCDKHNAETKGSAANSYHVRGMAADILVPNHFHGPLSRKYHGRLGIGFYDNRLHVDVRTGCARWGRIPKEQDIAKSV